jgi:hypothetical protein
MMNRLLKHALETNFFSATSKTNGGQTMKNTNSSVNSSHLSTVLHRLINSAYNEVKTKLEDSVKTVAQMSRFFSHSHSHTRIRTDVTKSGRNIR